MWEMQILASSDGSATETVTATGSAASNASTPRFVSPPGKELSRAGWGGEERASKRVLSLHNCSMLLCDFNLTQSLVNV